MKNLQEIDHLKTFDPSHLDILLEIIKINKTVFDTAAGKRKQSSTQPGHEENAEVLSKGGPGETSESGCCMDKEDLSQDGDEHRLQRILDNVKQRADDLSGKMKKIYFLNNFDRVSIIRIIGILFGICFPCGIWRGGFVSDR